MPKIPINKTRPDYWPDEQRELCALDALPENTARGFTLIGNAPDARLDVIVWRAGDRLSGFVNKCPHMGLPLETFPDRFLTATGDALICSAHGAQFDAAGKCFAGPCKGQNLKPVTLKLVDGMITLCP